MQKNNKIVTNIPYQQHVYQHHTDVGAQQLQNVQLYKHNAMVTGDSVAIGAVKVIISGLQIIS